MKYLLVVGSGLSGAVLARELAESYGFKILVIDKRNHIAGNCYTFRDNETGIMVHQYGAHIFHTSSPLIWQYVLRFSNIYPFINRPKASIFSGVYQLPVNLHTINQFFGSKLTPEEAKNFIRSKATPISEPKNFEEQALKYMGRELYEAFFYGYTRKQWGCEPTELPASIMKRIPVRFNYNDNYYDSIYQGIPVEGYTDIVEKILSHERINVHLGTPWDRSMIDDFEHIFFTGPLDAFFNYSFGRLSYRTSYWQRSIHNGDYQGHPAFNYPEMNVPFTRVREHKHYTPWEKHDKTIVFTEFSKETEPCDEPFYPIRMRSDLQILDRYFRVAEKEQKVSFLGRLGTYRYLDMHQVISESLVFAKSWSEAYYKRIDRPVFPSAAFP
ncbi:MAG: UDP-galactopyranose mutase [Chlorobiaceae bacterium]|nr:UDP-galactopyranose mutase [Chlorobiaceae bacterium]